jgi:hypothetical protein
MRSPAGVRDRCAPHERAAALFVQRDAAGAAPPHSPLLPEIDGRLAPWLREAIAADEPRREFLLAL